MKPDDIQAALADIRGTGDELIKNLKLAGLLGTLFKEKGWELVMVGGSAIEVYTEGRYMSGDIDMCGKMGMPPPKIKAEVMASLGATGGPRNFRLDDRWIDLLGQVERMSPATYQVIETAYGEVTLMPVENCSLIACSLPFILRQMTKRRPAPKNLWPSALVEQSPPTGRWPPRWPIPKNMALGRNLSHSRMQLPSVLLSTNLRKMNNPKTTLTWEQWIAARATRRLVSDRINPGSIRRKSSTSDKRLRATFNGERGPVLR